MLTAPAYASEFYTVGPTIDVVVTLKATSASARIRLEALEGSNGDYSVKSYIEEHVTIQPTYPQANGKFMTQPKDVRIWADYDLPWVSHKSADAALNQALGFLSKRCVNKT